MPPVPLALRRVGSHTLATQDEGDPVDQHHRPIRQGFAYIKLGSFFQAMT